MKVLHVINSLVAAGAENLVVTLANEQVKTNQVSVFTFYSEKDVFAEKLDKSIDFLPHKGQRYFSFRKIFHLFKCIKEHDIIHVHLFPPFYIVAILSFLTKKKVFVYTEHSTQNERRKSIMRWFEKFIYSRYDYIVCISDGVYSALKAWVGDSANAVIVKNVINIDFVNDILPESRENLGCTQEDVILVMIGRFQPPKDQKTIIQALCKLPQNYKLLLIGEGELEKELKSLAKDLGVKERINFMGLKKNVFKILKSCDIGIISSKSEGFGLVALEYMASGLPAIGSNNEGLQEVIGTSEALFETGNHEQLSELILKITTDFELKKSIQNIQEIHLKTFDLQHAILAHQQVYENKYIAC